MTNETITIFDADPEITISRDKVATATWLLDTDAEGKETHATIDVIHLGRPRYAYSGTLRQQTVEYSNGFTVRGFMVFDGVRIPARGGANRYNAAKQREYLDACVETIRYMAHEGDPEVLAIFTVTG